MKQFLKSLQNALSQVIELAPESYLEEPRGRFTSEGLPLIRPRTTQDVVDIVKHCNSNDIAIVPYAGGTSLVGGQIMQGNQRAVLVSVERMNKIRAIHSKENAITVEAGVILEDVKDAANEVERLFPLSLAAQGTARIGGNLATNAGGVQVLRYGNARDLCLGIEAVLPDGTIYNGLKRLRKDNTGYDIKNLLIGSEGSLGIITAACLKLFPKPKDTTTAFIAIESPSHAIDLLAMLQSDLDNSISAFELMHEQGHKFLKEKLPNIKLPFDAIPKWSILLEASGFGAKNRLFEGLSGPMEEGWVSDALIAQSEAQAQEMWNVRENIPIANKAVGSIASQDLSIPISKIPKFIEEMPDELAKLDDFRINCFGHLGDGNLHFNIFPAEGRKKSDYAHLRDDIRKTIHDKVHAMDGSISAEHGIGRLKVEDLERYGDPGKLTAMRAIKAALDPNGIMNPGVILALKD